MKYAHLVIKKIKKHQTIVSFICLFFIVVLVFLGNLNKTLINTYKENQSFVVSDRNDDIFYISKNKKGYYASYTDTIPASLKNILIKKEDRFFYWHFGFNPWSIARAILNKVGVTDQKASSTITQQLAKILLEKENERTIGNKVSESFYTLALELFNSKKTIMNMYINSMYLGNQIQGIETASNAYFNTSIQNLTTGQTMQLLTTINNPSNLNPLTENNIERSEILSRSLDIKSEGTIDKKTSEENLQEYIARNKPILELSPYLSESLDKNIKVTIDKGLQEQVRSIVSKNIDYLKTKKAHNASVVILSTKNNEILTIVGSPDPRSNTNGNQINMAVEPRQIGSTIKPFIYLKAFEKGMRPYTLIDDREYKYIGPNGYPFYPKNYDLKYYGEMTAHYALSNSINVVALKTLDFVGVDTFNHFMTDTLGYVPIQPMERYQLGTALGNLEMNLLNLTHYFSIFPGNGHFSNLRIFTNQNENEKYFPYNNKNVADNKYIELVTKILSDRKTGVDQFGGKSLLNLPNDNYGLKTGTSHDYTDSWVVGYTPDFIVGVWVGNADSSPTDSVSGQKGAGTIWNDVMQVMYNSTYNKNTAFDFSDIQEYQGKNGVEFGLPDDDFESAENIIKDQDNAFIMSPHRNDVFLFIADTEISLEAKESAEWFINGEKYLTGKKVFFSPTKSGTYTILAKGSGASETISIKFIDSYNKN